MHIKYGYTRVTYTNSHIYFIQGYFMVNIFNLNMMKISKSIYIMLLYLMDIYKMFLYSLHNIYTNKNIICYKVTT